MARKSKTNADTASGGTSEDTEPATEKGADDTSVGTGATDQPTEAPPDQGSAGDAPLDESTATGEPTEPLLDEMPAQGSGDDAGLAGDEVAAEGREADWPVRDDTVEAEAETAGAADYQEHGDDTGEYHDDHLHAEEAHGSSLAAKVLTGVALIAVGVALTLWGGPKLAPHLPQGMAPVRAWLMPGEAAAQAEVQALREDLDARLAEVPPPVDSAAIEASVTGSLEARLDERLTAERAALTERIDALTDEVTAMGGDSLPGRLTAVETRIDGMAAELDKLSQMLLGVAESGGELNAEASAQIATFAAAVEGLKAELASLANKNGQLADRLEEVAASAERRVAAAQADAESAAERAAREAREAKIDTALATIDGALTTGESYEPALKALQEADVEVPEALSAAAGTGVVTMNALRADFGSAAHQAIRAAIKASSDDSLSGRLSSFFESQVASRSLNPIEGQSPDAVLSRAEAALAAGDLGKALGELKALPSESTEAMSEWLSAATARHAAVEALTGLEEAPGASSGSGAGQGTDG